MTEWIEIDDQSMYYFVAYCNWKDSSDNNSHVYEKIKSIEQFRYIKCVCLSTDYWDWIKFHKTANSREFRWQILVKVLMRLSVASSSFTYFCVFIWSLRKEAIVSCCMLQTSRMGNQHFIYENWKFL